MESAERPGGRLRQVRAAVRPRRRLAGPSARAKGSGFDPTPVPTPAGQPTPTSTSGGSMTSAGRAPGSPWASTASTSTWCRTRPGPGPVRARRRLPVRAGAARRPGQAAGRGRGHDGPILTASWEAMVEDGAAGASGAEQGTGGCCCCWGCWSWPSRCCSRPSSSAAAARRQGRYSLAALLILAGLVLPGRRLLMTRAARRSFRTPSIDAVAAERKLGRCRAAAIRRTGRAGQGDAGEARGVGARAPGGEDGRTFRPTATKACMAL